MTTPPFAPPPAGLPLRKYVAGLAPVVLIWAVLVFWVVNLLYDRANWADRSDEATVREWLDEARNFRKTLPELVREYAALRADNPDPEAVRQKGDEIEAHVRALGEPTRAYANQLPAFPEVYRIEVVVPEGPSLVWDSNLPRPRRQTDARVRVLEFRPLDDNPRVVISCEYRMHAFNRLQAGLERRQQDFRVAGALLVAGTLFAVLFVYRFLTHERRRDLATLSAVAEAEHHERELLEARVLRQEAERVRDELDKQLLKQNLEAADLERRAAEAENSALEMKSQLYASIGIMAGSYAHNIKNLLVRPNDLLARCIEVNGLSHEQEGMLHEVQSTLGTVTDRLQQILRTVRRDPNKADVTRIDVAELVRDTARTWADMARDKWKLTITADPGGEPLPIDGDLSHLQQAVENLLFNARDATFEMRNHLREEARRDAGLDPAARRQRLIDAAGWKGEVRLAARRDAAGVVLEIRDNGIGMTEEVRRNCMTAHFTTKRENALYEGYSAGMGLGLSFVAVVLEHHRAAVAIESEPLKGATFRVTFPAV